MMPPAFDQLRKYSDPEEQLVAAYTATLSDKSQWQAASIGLTDRRLLCVADNDGFVTLGYDSISTIRSHPRTTHTYRGNDYRLVLGAGSLLAVLGLGGIVALTTAVVVPLLALGTVGGLAAVVYLRRDATKIKREMVATLLHRVTDLDSKNILPRSKSREVDTGDVYNGLLVGSVVLAVGSFIGMVFLASSGFIVLATLVLIGGVAVLDYAHQHKTDFDGIEIIRHHETEVSISTNDGQTIHIRCDLSDNFGQELSRLTFTEEETPARIVSASS